MVNVGISKVDDKVAAKHPGLETYTACQSMAFVKATEFFICGTISLYAIQTLIQKRFPYPSKYKFLISTVVPAIASNIITHTETQQCIDLWVLVEKGTVPDRSAPQPVSQPEESKGPKKTQYGDVIE